MAVDSRCKTNRKWLSVVIPTHNRKDLLADLLQALARETYPAGLFEVVVVVDGSTDGTLEMLDTFRAPYMLSVVSQEKGGASRSRNAGIHCARGEVIIFLDDDVVPAPGFLDAHAYYHDIDQKAVVIGRLSPSEKSSRPGWSHWEEQLLGEHFTALATRRRRVGGRHLYSGNFSVRKRHLIRVAGFDESLARAEDIDLGFRLEGLGLNFYFSPKANVAHRGYRSYSSWSETHYEYGRLDVVLGRDKGLRRVMDDVFSSFHRRNVVLRACVAASLDHRDALWLSLGLLRSAALGGDNLGLHRLTRYFYSAISNLLYWQGVSDELGGKAAFWQEIRRYNTGTAGRTYDFSHTN